MSGNDGSRYTQRRRHRRCRCPSSSAQRQSPRDTTTPHHDHLGV